MLFLRRLSRRSPPDEIDYTVESNSATREPLLQMRKDEYSGGDAGGSSGALGGGGAAVAEARRQPKDGDTLHTRWKASC